VPEPRTGREQLTQPVYRVAQETNGLPAPPAAVGNLNAQAAPPQGEAAAAQPHPLEPALQMAYAAMTNIRNNVKDYSCTLVKRERIGGKLNEQEFMFLKIRHEPFSVYLYYLGPDRIRGQEAIYVAGRNNGNLLGHGVGIRKIAGTVPLLPTGAMAMQGQRYPITEIGMFNLTRRLVQVAEADKRFGECEVKFFKNAKINNRSVTCIQVMHPVPRKNFLFHLARVWVDDELNLPVRYESYDWPLRPGEKPPLLEEYTYTDIKLNNNFTDMDFSETNPKYNFR
jgi:outer membrane lipoprotein-sorting protein